VELLSRADFLAILRVLEEHEVEFLVAGGVAAVLHGAPLATFDLDLVHARSPENVSRLLAALEALGAYFRTHPETGRAPDASHLSSPGGQLLMTRFGPLDLLGAVGKGHGYEDLKQHCTRMDIGEGLRVQVLDLEKLIQIREAVSAEKDRASLPLLRRTLEEKRRA